MRLLATGFDASWTMRSEKLSPAWTTRQDALQRVTGESKCPIETSLGRMFIPHANTGRSITSKTTQIEPTCRGRLNGRLSEHKNKKALDFQGLIRCYWRKG
ncbi:DUF4113 domain-containing protein [Zoogloea sp.]|uniref:DUF4113 domain-containing protein n=1 Tax=Zoogloea sp. TaxID=49181 RepID=UPI00344856B4